MSSTRTHSPVDNLHDDPEDDNLDNDENFDDGVTGAGPDIGDLEPSLVPAVSRLHVEVSHKLTLKIDSFKWVFKELTTYRCL